jgi:hypothetical protein
MHRVYGLEYDYDRNRSEGGSCIRKEFILESPSVKKRRSTTRSGKCSPGSRRSLPLTLMSKGRSQDERVLLTALVLCFGWLAELDQSAYQDLRKGWTQSTDTISLIQHPHSQNIYLEFKDDHANQTSFGEGQLGAYCVPCGLLLHVLFLIEHIAVDQLMYHRIHIKKAKALSRLNIMNVYHLTEHGQLEPKFVFDFGGDGRGMYHVCYWENR